MFSSRHVFSSRHFSRNFGWHPSENPWWSRLLAACLLTTACTNAFSADVNVVGLFPGKALVSIDGGPPRTLSAGQKTAEGVTLLSVASDSATFEIDGQRRILRIGQPFRSSGRSADADTIVLSPDTRGSYVTVGAINGKSVRFVVDTGATTVALGATLASQLGIAYRQGRPVTVSTANGNVGAFVIVLDSVRVGGITLDKVEAAVSDGMNGWDGVLLGMSFIGRLAIQRDGQILRLSRPASQANSQSGSQPTQGSATTAGKGGTASSGTASNDKRERITLRETQNGMYAVNAKINGVDLPFLVDTGATTVSMDAALAQQAGIAFRNGTAGWSNTANGPVKSWRVRLDSVAVGPITLYGIDATVREGPGTGGIGLLGMTFLNRIEMKREGESLTLIKRF